MKNVFVVKFKDYVGRFGLEFIAYCTGYDPTGLGAPYVSKEAYLASMVIDWVIDEEQDIIKIVFSEPVTKHLAFLENKAIDFLLAYKDNDGGFLTTKPRDLIFDCESR